MDYNHTLSYDISLKDFIVKLDFEIAVDQGSGTKEQTFGGVPDPQCQ